MVIMTCTLRALAYLRPFGVRSSVHSSLRSSHSFEGSIFVTKGAEESNLYFFYIPNKYKEESRRERRAHCSPPILSLIRTIFQAGLSQPPFMPSPSGVKTDFSFQNTAGDPGNAVRLGSQARLKEIFYARANNQG
jgi:hypothetical protein